MSFISVNDIKPKEIVPGFKGRFIHSENITIAYWDITQGSAIPIHQHVHEMMVNVISGKLELTIGTETKILEPGIVGVIPSQVPHTAKALTDCKVVDVFYPVRTDYNNE
jgi:quercetin dioxygenase-like cupin family protein